jgi:hypothetical protein
MRSSRSPGALVVLADAALHRLGLQHAAADEGGPHVEAAQVGAHLPQQLCGGGQVDRRLSACSFATSARTFNEPAA